MHQNKKLAFKLTAWLVLPSAMLVLGCAGIYYIQFSAYVKGFEVKYSRYISFEYIPVYFKKAGKWPSTLSGVRSTLEEMKAKGGRISEVDSLLYIHDFTHPEIRSEVDRPDAFRYTLTFHSWLGDTRHIEMTAKEALKNAKELDYVSPN